MPGPAGVASPGGSVRHSMEAQQAMRRSISHTLAELPVELAVGRGQAHELSEQPSLQDELLQHGPDMDSAGGGSPADEPIAAEGWLAQHRAEANRLTALAWPISVAGMFAHAGSFAVTAMVGHLGSMEMSAYFLAGTLTSSTGSGLETYGGQAVGSNRHNVLGLVLQRAVLLSLLAAVPCVLLWVMAGEQLLVVLGQEPDIAREAAHYAVLWSPTLFLLALSECIRRYLVVQGIVVPVMIVGGLASLISPAWCAAFMYGTGWGLDGAAIAMWAITATKLALLLGYIAVYQRRSAVTQQALQGLSRQAFVERSATWAYMGVAAPSTAMTALHWWSYEAIILLAGLLPNARVMVAAMGLALRSHAWCFLGVNGLADAVSTRISNELGANRPAAARLSMRVAMLLGFGVMVFFCAIVLATRDVYAQAFSSDPAVVGAFRSVTLPLALSLLGDGLTNIIFSVLQGCGRTRLGAVTNLIVIWLCGLPLACGLAFGAHMGIAGFWWGQVAISVVMTGILLACLGRFDWQDEASKAAARMQASLGPALPETVRAGPPDSFADRVASKVELPSAKRPDLSRRNTISTSLDDAEV